MGVLSLSVSFPLEGVEGTTLRGSAEEGIAKIVVARRSEGGSRLSESHGRLVGRFVHDVKK